MPDFDIQGDRCFPDAGNPQHGCFAAYIIRGDLLVRTAYHFRGRMGVPVYVIRERLVFRTDRHEDGQDDRPMYEIR